MDSDNNVYIKQGRKYIPFGRRYQENYLSNGIWYVHHNEHSVSHTNVDRYLSGIYKVGETPDYIDIPKLCSMQRYVDYVLASPEFREILDSGHYSLLDITAKIVALVVNLNKTIKEKKSNDDNKRSKRDFNAF